MNKHGALITYVSFCTAGWKFEVLHQVSAEIIKSILITELWFLVYIHTIWKHVLHANALLEINKQLSASGEHIYCHPGN